MGYYERNQRTEPERRTFAAESTDSPWRAAPRALRAARRAWARTAGYQRFAYAVAALLLVSALFHVGVFLVSGTSWGGPVSWRKPITFGLSFGVALTTFAWVVGRLPERRLRNWLLLGTFAIAGALEVGSITMQRWRGVASHFNRATPFDASVFEVMGVLIVLVALSIVAITLLSFVSLRTSPHVAIAIRAGLAIFVGGLAVGGLLIAHGFQVTTDPATGTFVPAGLTSAAMFGAAGDMVLPHALAFHAIQVLVVLAWLLDGTDWSERRRVEAVGVAAVGSLGVVIAAFLTALAGRAPTDPAPLATILLLGSLLLVVGTYGSTLFAFRRRGRRFVSER